jgi:hypothetical protein
LTSKQDSLSFEEFTAMNKAYKDKAVAAKAAGPGFFGKITEGIASIPELATGLVDTIQAAGDTIFGKPQGPQMRAVRPLTEAEKAADTAFMVRYGLHEPNPQDYSAPARFRKAFEQSPVTKWVAKNCWR